MNKKRKIYCVLGIIFSVCGMVVIGLAANPHVLGADKGGIGFKMLQAAGVVLLCGAVACIYKYLSVISDSVEEFKREEKDERNVMIRGKAAENTVLWTMMAMLVLEVVFIYMDYETPAILLAAVMFFCSLQNILWIVYYERKY